MYDYVDVHISLLQGMYYKRLRAYKKIGYEVMMHNQTKQRTNAIFDSKTYSEVYERDLREANHEIVISSPWLNAYSVRKLMGIVNDMQVRLTGRYVSVSVMTRPSSDYSKQRINAMQELLDDARHSGITVREIPDVWERFAVIDQEIVWYGDMNLLGKKSDDNSLMRLQDKGIAEELLLMVIGKDSKFV